MKFRLALFILTFFQFSNSQVGIGTTNPTKTLDVDGELRIRNIPIISDGQILSTDTDGNIGKFNTYLLFDVASVIATTDVNVAINANTTINNVNLGLSTTITIPANKEAQVIITYSVPIGFASSSSFADGSYYGIRFLKDGVEAQQGSRKFSIVNANNYNMVTISNTYTETFTSFPSDRTVSYTLNGYIENNIGSHTYKFNMWSSTGANFNWGKATLTKTVYIR